MKDYKMKKLGSNGYSIVYIFLTVLVLIIIIGSGYFVYNRNHTPKTASEVLSQIATDSHNKYSNADFQYKDNWDAEYAASTFTKVDGYDYSISSFGRTLDLIFGSDVGGEDNPNKARTDKYLLFFNKTVQPAKTLDEIKNYIEKQMASYGFSSEDNQTFKKGEISCTVLNDDLELYANIEHEPGEKTNVLQVRCYNASDLQLQAEKMKPFVDGFLGWDKEANITDISVGPLTIKSEDGSGVISASKSQGYDLAEIVITRTNSKIIGLYYKKDEGNWKFITSAPDEYGFYCAEIRQDPDARKAFYDQVCYENDQIGQVRLDTNNRATQ